MLMRFYLLISFSILTSAMRSPKTARISRRLGNILQLCYCFSNCAAVLFSDTLSTCEVKTEVLQLIYEAIENSFVVLCP
jgi:hypothetical protein